MADWKSGLRPGAFRGVRFHTRDRGFETGRAIVTHEFPKRNSPDPEDMGKEARKWSVDVYVIGDDYISRRDALIAACEKPGAGSYTDHWGRSSRVVCDKCSLKETSDEGRMARLSLSFIEAGGGLSPIAAIATAAQLSGTASGLAATAVAAFANSGVVAQSPASLGTALGRLGLSPHMATALVSGLASGALPAVADAVKAGLGLELSQPIIPRVAGSVLPAATRPAVTELLSQ